MNDRTQKVLCVAFSILLITGAVKPVMATSGGGPFGQAADAEAPVSTYQPLSEGEGELTALELKYTAVTELATLQPADQSDEQRRKQAAERINETLDVYIDGDRVESAAAFEGDAAAVSRLAALADDDPARVNETTRLLTKANARTANVSITDAQRALNRFEDDLDNPGHRNAIESHIRNAERAYERGEQALESDGNVKQTVQDRERAIRHFMTAWRQSQQALDTIERQTTPQVQILTRLDPVRNGSDPTNRTIGGTIKAVRPAELGNVTVTVEGGPSVEVQPSTSTVPASAAMFTANVTFEDREQRIRATLEDSTNGKHGHGNGPPAHANGKSSTADASPTTDELLLDGDALSDTYERETTKTDPLNPDSTSTKTTVDESGNGVIDGIEDFDSDNVTSYHEGRFGTDPFDEDTDDDGLPDRYEIRYSKLDQTRTDTNDDGVTDDEWDIDNDSLTTLEEYEAGTRPTMADEDRDDLNDSRELEVGTNSSDPDTDGDGLLDGEELDLGTDPLVRDSNGDGTLDGNATYTTQTANESLSVNVSLSGNGDIASGVTIEDGSQARFNTDSIESAQVTSFVNLESEQSFESANVTFSYDDSQLGETNESDLVVFRYNESLRMFEPLNTTVDPESNTVTGETEHFSRFVVFDVRNWASNFVADRPENGADKGEVQPVDVTMIIDTSGSMGWNDPEEFRKQAAKEFVGALVEDDRAGVVDFDNDAYVAQELTTDFGQVNLTVDSLDASGGTDIGDGVRKANEHFEGASNDSRAQFAILLTDGQGDGGRAEARTAAQRNTTIYTIGFGDANGDKLEDIAQITNGNYTPVDDPGDLPNVFSRVAEDIGTQDTDGDGIPDATERRGGFVGGLGMVETDPYNADTDGDGLDDGTELGEPITPSEFRSLTYGEERLDPQSQEYHRALVIQRTIRSSGYSIDNFSGLVYASAVSYPIRVDTDRDGVDDYTELREPMTYAATTDRGETEAVLEADEVTAETLEDAYDPDQATSDPWVPDTDHDGLDDGRERELATNPDDDDTDGDGIRDGIEMQGRNDPTLYDTIPPEIEIHDSGWDLSETSLDSTYEVLVSMEDDAVIDDLAFIKGGTTKKVHNINHDEIDHWVYGYEDEAVEIQKIDRSDWRSRAKSSAEAAWDAGGDVLETVADVTVGTTIHVRVTDSNGNSQQVIGVQRENFYGHIAGDLSDDLSSDLTDDLVARNLGMISGFSASLGTSVRELQETVENPMALVEGIREMARIIRNADPALISALKDSYIEQFKEKQKRNNPYKSGTENYNSFKTNWYNGYAIGFVSKMALDGGSSGGKTALKITDRSDSITKRLSDSRALKALSRVSDASDTAKARVTARILLGFDDAAEPLLSQGDTAGQVYQLWRHQRAMDADVDSLSDLEHSRLARALSNADVGARDGLYRMDQDSLSELMDLDIDTQTRARLAPRYADLDADGRNAVREFVDQTDNLDSATRDALREGYARGDIDIQTGEKNNIAEEIQTYSGYERVDGVERTGRGTNVRGVVNGQDSGDIKVTGRFYRDGDAYVRESLNRNSDEVERIFRKNGGGDLYDESGVDAIDRLDEVSGGDAVNIRGQIGEEVLQPELASNKYGRGGFEFDGDSGSLDQGYIPEGDIPYDLDAGNQGFDGFAIDNDGNLVVIETKVKNSNGRVTNAQVFGDPLSNGERQMSDVWIEDRLQNLVDDAETNEQKEFIKQLADDDGANAIEVSERNGEINLNGVNEENLNTELITYQDGDQTGELASRGLRQADDEEPTLDSVEIVKVGDVFNDI